MESSSSDKSNQKPRKPVVFGLPKHREKVINAISEAFANNDLDIEEYERRLEMAHDAKSIQDLRQAVYDFPQVNTLVPAPAQANSPQRQNETNPYAPSTRPDYAPSPAETFRRSFEELDFISLIGDRKINSIDVVKPNLKIVTGIGDTIVDLREVSYKHSFVHIENFCAIGNIKIRVPHNAQVSKKMFTLIGDSKRRQIGKSFIKKFLGINQNKPMRYDPNQPVLQVEISGLHLIGDLIIEYMPDPNTYDYY